ncbi:hypothetical protein MLD38_034720 [Melastoma candidum]|uniref:Uncharacterized protein n=1 Tax=Melastoma candidum TaxID=119954 RepID=A0ACB9MBC7_9MYRT|nr:hypothetical protein MLD38_034720 [Melastoma candidum]
MEILKDVASDEYSRLPKQFWWGSDCLYEWRGFWFRLPHLPGIRNVAEHFDPAPGDVVLASFPKTGTTWMKALLYSIIHQGDFSCSLRDKHPHELIHVMELQDFGPSAVSSSRGSGTERHTSTGIHHTHIPFSILADKYRTSECRIIYVTRNPKDTLISLWHFACASDTFASSASLQDLVEKFCSGVVPYGSYYNHVLEHWKESLERPDKVLFVSYEELKADQKKQIKRIAKFLSQPFHGNDEDGVVEEIVRSCSFKSMSEYEANKSREEAEWLGLPYNAFFRKGEVGDHKNYLNEEMIEKINRKTVKKFHDAGFMYGI